MTLWTKISLKTRKLNPLLLLPSPHQTPARFICSSRAAPTAVKDVINADVLDDDDSVVNWIVKTIKTVWDPETVHKQHDTDGNCVWWPL